MYDLSVKKKADKPQGFTLIELLVSVIIIGMLSAIALPSYLNQTSKVKGAEAKANLGTIQRAQQIYYLEKSTLANALNLLDAKINQRFYSYGIVASTVNTSTTTTTTQEADLKGYSARMQQSGSNFIHIICESDDTVGLGTAASTPSSVVNCPTGYNPIN